MTQKIYATVLKFDTEACQAESIDARKARFENALRDANKFIAAKSGGMGSHKQNAQLVRNIFVAPEYSFANPLNHANHGVGDVRHLSEGAKVDIEAWLKGLSVQYPKTLIFPGSIAWKKALVRDLRTYLKNKEATSDQFNRTSARLRFQAKTQTRQEKSIASIRSGASQFQGNNLNRGVSGPIQGNYACTEWDPGEGVWWYEIAHPSMPGAVFYNGKYWTKDPKSAKRLVLHAAPTPQSKLDALTGGTATNMAHNTSLIYLNGKKQAKYHKAKDYHEVLDEHGDTVYVPGNSVPTFTVDGKVYGVELCLDHVFASLTTRLPVGKVPDIVVLMSAKVVFNAANLPNPSAMVIHACSKKEWSFVGRGGVADADVTKEDPATTWAYTIYSFEV